MTQPSDTVSPQSGEPNVVVVKQSGGWFGKLLIFFGLLAVLCAGYVALVTFKVFPSIFKNPFERPTSAESGPVLIERIADASEYLAARGSFQVVVTQEDHLELFGLNLGWVSGCKAVFVGYGDVDAYVDVSGLTEDAIVVSGDGRAVTVTLPKPQLSDVDPNVTESYRISQERGIWERFIGLFQDSGDCVRTEELFQLAEAKIAEAAAESDLLQRAQTNTEVFIKGLLEQAGYERVDVIFSDEPVTPNPTASSTETVNPA